MKTKILQNRELFAAGTWNGLPFSEADLDGIVSAFNALNMGGAVPLKLGHVTPTPDKPERQFAMGWVNSVRRMGKKLFGDLEVPTRVADLVEEKFLKFVSVELLQDVQAGTKIIPWVLSAVALLGTEPPAVGVLKELQAVTMSRRPDVRARATRVFQRQVSTRKEKQMDETEVQRLLKEQEERLTKLFTKQLDDVKKASDEAVAAAKKAERDAKVSARKDAINAMFTSAIEAKRILPATQERFQKLHLKTDDAVLEVKDAEVKEFIDQFHEVDKLKIKQDDKGGGRQTGDDDDAKRFAGKTNMQVFTAKVEERILKTGGKLTDWQAHETAARHVMREDEALGRAYLDDPRGEYKTAA